VSQSYGERYRHTAHELSLATIHYRYHPFSGEEVEIMRRFRRYTAESVLVKILQNGLQVAVPAWMLDAAACAHLRDDTQPCVALAALLELRALLDSQPWLASSAYSGDREQPDRSS
jgi:hypothetical protein